MPRMSLSLEKSIKECDVFLLVLFTYNIKPYESFNSHVVLCEYKLYYDIIPFIFATVGVRIVVLIGESKSIYKNVSKICVKHNRIKVSNPSFNWFLLFFAVWRRSTTPLCADIRLKATRRLILCSTRYIPSRYPWHCLIESTRTNPITCILYYLIYKIYCNHRLKKFKNCTFPMNLALINNL